MDLTVPWFPTIGMGSPGEKIEGNLGSKPFVYNIELENILQESHAKDLARSTLQCDIANQEEGHIVPEQLLNTKRGCCCKKCCKVLMR